MWPCWSVSLAQILARLISMDCCVNDAVLCLWLSIVPVLSLLGRPTWPIMALCFCTVISFFCLFSSANLGIHWTESKQNFVAFQEVCQICICTPQNRVYLHLETGSEQYLFLDVFWQLCNLTGTYWPISSQWNMIVDSWKIETVPYILPDFYELWSTYD